ncbi:MAG: RtcB family protein, partial [Lentisphaerae bacterium]
HFIELQRAESDGALWLMLHSGSRNLGYRIAEYYHRQAQALNRRMNVNLPSADLAFLPLDDETGQAYFRDMHFALEYAAENRRRMLRVTCDILANVLPGIEFAEFIEIHHNFAAREQCAGQEVIVHRKGATPAFTGMRGIIPGSMGTASYIVEGKGNPLSLNSCSHGAGRRLGRNEACRVLSVEACERAMQGVIHSPWRRQKRSRKKQIGSGLDLSEAPQAYKDIESVLQAESDLVTPLERLKPLAVVKG